MKYRTIRLALSIVPFLVVLGCRGSGETRLAEGTSRDQTAPDNALAGGEMQEAEAPQEPSAGYFPESFEMDEIMIEWFSATLEEMGEAPLPVSGATEAYRFTHLPAFGRPIAVRVWESDGGIVFRLAEYEPGTGEVDSILEVTGRGEAWTAEMQLELYRQGTVTREKQSTLAIEDWGKLREHFQAVRFWELAPTIRRPGVLELDGTELILEAYRNGSHHAVHRRSHMGPRRYAEFRSLCLHFMELAGEISSLEPRELPLELQRSAYLLVADSATGRAVKASEARVLCLGVGPLNRWGDPDSVVLESISVDDFAVVGASSCARDSASLMETEKTSGHHAMLLSLDSAAVVDDRELALYLTWQASAMDAESYRCRAVQQDERWQLGACAGIWVLGAWHVDPALLRDYR